MTDARRSIELEVEVAGTPEEVWRAIATGPGITSWYVPHTVEERAGGIATASFGPAPEMQITGRVAAWDPPRRIVFDGGEGVEGFAFEWTIEARAGGTCVVRLVNSGFGSGAEWDEQYDAMTEGWRLFLLNLELHLAHFRGRIAVPMLPTAGWSATPDEAWARLCRALGLPTDAVAGDRVAATAAGAPSLAGTLVRVQPRAAAILLDEPAPGTAFVAVEGTGDQVQVSVWSYLYGPESTAIVGRDLPRWQDWLGEHAAASSSTR